MHTVEILSGTMFKIELRADGIIYVERTDRQAEQALRGGFGQVGELAGQLRRRGKPVLILNRARSVGVSEQVLRLLQHFDFDRLAVYGTSGRTNSQRDLMVRANGLESKITSFGSEADALAWLRTYRP